MDEGQPESGDWLLCPSTMKQCATCKFYAIRRHKPKVVIGYCNKYHVTAFILPEYDRNYKCRGYEYCLPEVWGTVKEERVTKWGIDHERGERT
jgi:hypothetical protein